MDYREKAVHGDEGLPVAVYEISPDHIRYRMNVHWHPEHEILFVQKGSIQMRLNDTTYKLNAGDVIFIPGGTIHSGEPDHCLYTCILVNLSLMMKKSDACMGFVNKIHDGSVIINTFLSQSFANPMSVLCAQMIEAYHRKNEGYPFEIKALIFSFFGQILNRHLYSPGDLQKSHRKTVPGRMKTIIEYIEKNYPSPIRLETLAEQADMTPNHFCRSFKTVTGLTPFEYITDYRLSKAQYALKTTEMSVTEIALGCGFNDVSHFIQIFKKVYGVTPKKYRDSEAPESDF